MMVNQCKYIYVELKVLEPKKSYDMPRYHLSQEAIFLQMVWPVLMVLVKRVASILLLLQEAEELRENRSLYLG